MQEVRDVHTKGAVCLENRLTQVESKKQIVEKKTSDRSSQSSQGPFISDLFHHHLVDWQRWGFLLKFLVDWHLKMISLIDKSA